MLQHFSFCLILQLVLSFCYRNVSYIHKCFFTDTLKDLFEEYNYNVRVEREVTATDMLRSVQHYAKKAESNCFLCFISSHGDLSSLECVKKTRRSTEKISVELEDLYEAANTEELKGCPKMFFIDACREGNCVLKNWE